MKERKSIGRVLSRSLQGTQSFSHQVEEGWYGDSFFKYPVAQDDVLTSLRPYRPIHNRSPSEHSGVLVCACEYVYVCMLACVARLTACIHACVHERNVKLAHTTR
jgi:hypothetical protein